MTHKPQLVRVGKAVPDTLKRMQAEALTHDMLDQVLSSEVRSCAWDCNEPEELHVQMCVICYEKAEDCGYSVSIKGVKL